VLEGNLPVPSPSPITITHHLAMKLSTRSRYGLRAMMVLAMSEDGRSVMTKEIAEKQNLPATYLEQLMLT